MASTSTPKTNKMKVEKTGAISNSKTRLSLILMFELIVLKLLISIGLDYHPGLKSINVMYEFFSPI